MALLVFAPVALPAWGMLVLGILTLIGLIVLATQTDRRIPALGMALMLGIAMVVIQVDCKVYFWLWECWFL